MSERAFIFKIVKAIEKTFNCFCFAKVDRNARGAYWWTICVDNPSVYSDKRFKSLSKSYYKLSKSKGVGVLFAYCHPNEEKLLEYSLRGELIINV